MRMAHKDGTMLPISDYALDRWLGSALVMFVLVWSLVGALVGAGLIVGSATTLRLLSGLNHYVSTRRGLKSMSVAYDLDDGARRNGRLVGGIVLIGAAYSVYALLAWFDIATLVSALGLSYPRPLVAWMLESIRWSLLLFNLVAVAVGGMLVLRAGALAGLEARANRWYSVRKLTLGADTMHLGLDRLFAEHPRVCGAMLLVGAIYVAGNTALLWSRLQ